MDERPWHNLGMLHSYFLNDALKVVFQGVTSFNNKRSLN